MSPIVLLHFHPDWPFGAGTVIEAMARSGRYCSQFETGTSNGGLTAHSGGDRWRWESRLFNARYDEGPASDRPVYGAVDLRDPYGAAPRFGSSFLRLTPEASARASFCYPDSVLNPVGVVGASGVPELVARMDADDPDVLDQYVEAHVHGGIVFADDVEAVVLDPCFRGTPTHASAERLARVEFHPGFKACSDSLDSAYRGVEFAALARSLGEVLVPDIIGAAARAATHDQQALKRVWHLLAKHGRERLRRESELPA